MGVHRLHQLAKAGKLTVPAMNVNGCVTKVSMLLSPSYLSRRAFYAARVMQAYVCIEDLIDRVRRKSLPCRISGIADRSFRP